jgi:lipopolysaccharide transport system ATP-binding protein
MSEIVIKAENISKQYRLGQFGTGTISHDLNRWWYKIRGKEDPYLKLGDINDRSKAGGSDYVWSLRDINFEVRRGEVLGIIGKNGAGKSTLLKILSQVTTPTTGQVNVKGRIASLLEVGTGFHPDLSGKENIFLNGAILGMTKAEIKSKLEEIVDFSGVAKYLDTPVKRYSSGMMVRLGFAVAAHLEPEILIVDEVLAVGDAEFQKKCLGKMKDVSGQGRTVLFVSHNLSAVKSLCTQVAYLEKGRIAEKGATEKVINAYLSESLSFSSFHRDFSDESEHENDEFKLMMYKLSTDEGTETIFIDQAITIQFVFRIKKPMPSFYIGVHVNNLFDECAFITTSQPMGIEEGLYEYSFNIPPTFLNDKTYVLDVYFVKNSNDIVEFAKKLIKFDVHDIPRIDGQFMGEYIGAIRPKLNWITKKIN